MASSRELGRRRAPRSALRTAMRRAGWLLGAVLVVVGVMLAVSASARAANCALADFAYNGQCGPEFESPAWGDAGGWTDPSKYSTIQLADISGDHSAELIARSDVGLEIWTFDTAVGQWRPAIGANGLPQVIRDLHSPLPTDDVRGSWRDPVLYSTIQTADLNGDFRQEVIANGPGGTSVWGYTPPQGTTSVNGGTWSRVSTQQLLPSSPAPSQYLSLHAVPAGFVPFATLTDQDAYWSWNAGSGGFQSSGNSTLAPNSTSRQYYLNNMSGMMPEILTSAVPELVPANVYRTPDGVAVQWYFGPGKWVQLGPPPTSGGQCAATNSCSPFPDTNCSAATGCFGSDPSYYETMRTATQLTGPDDPNGYVLGRLHDGLHVYALKTFGSGADAYQGWDDSIPVLTALADPSSGFPPPGEWSSIRTGDINGDGQTEVLAVVNGQLTAWELTSNGSGPATWTELPATPALNLGGSVWRSDASYYSTLEVGPVAAGAPDAVIARGPFGVRTWFYNRNGSGGWTSFMPQDISSYPQFAGGQAAAWTELNTRAQYGPNRTVRDLWTAATAPTDDALTNLNNAVLVFAGCSGETSANPPTYSSCAVPAGSSGFTAADWTAVVNETLAEIYYARQANDFFGQLSSLNSDTFLAKEAELPAIASSVAALGQAAGNNVTYASPEELWSAGLGIAGSIAGILNPVAGAALSMASYLAEIVPSATPAVTQPPFNTTLNGLQNDLANAVSDAGKAVDEQSYEVRRNYGMLRLVTQLTEPTGPWNAVNAAGLRGSMEQGFALWAYKQLLPTMLQRDLISGCSSSGGQEGYWYWQSCDMTPFAGGIGTDTDFTIVNSPATTDQNAAYAWPCSANGWGNIFCNYDRPPTGLVNGQPGTDIATKVWGPLADTCNFNGEPLTEWTFDCNLGVDPNLSTDAVGGPANGWNFTNCTGTPMLLFPDDGFPSVGSCSSATSAQATLGSRGSVKLTARLSLPPSFHVRSARLADKQLLYERGGQGKLVTRRSGRPLGTIRLTRGSAPAKRGAAKQAKRAGKPRRGTVLRSARGAPPTTLTLRRTSRGRARLTLNLRRVVVKTSHGCKRLPVSTATELAPFRLETAIRLSNGRRTRTLPLHMQWECKRSRSGAVTGMRTVAPPKLARHRGLAVSITGPRRVIPGSVATYTVRVHNERHRARSRYTSSLWHVVVHARLVPPAGRKTLAARVRDPGLRDPRPRRINELRHGKTRVLRIPVRIPRELQSAGIDRVCVGAGAMADSARPASARACSAIARDARPGAPRLTG